ncbi:SOS response-associated peptidase [Cytobacillus sp. FJAT-54145]|uniref:Abasic site processing protein n=1 Tax=Cytobacillus spartinae TaxID=3299023 RepID=A0ABW6K650_9BACI
MCGRFTLTDNILQLQAQFEFEFYDEYLPRYNIAPSQKVLAIGSNGERRKGSMLRWGLIPFWASDEKIGYKMINARSEGIEEKPSFKHAFKKRRCLVIADGFYEWKKLDDGKTKQPYRFVMKDRKPFAMAGLYEIWKKGTEPIVSCTVITTTPNKVTEDVHDRMPVILHENAYDTWMNPKFEDTEHLKSLLVPYPADEMEKYAVTSLVNSPKNEMAELLSPINSL